MRKFWKLLKGLVLLAVLAIVGAYLYLVIVPPELLRVGSGYSSKIICSASALSGRPAEEVLEIDVQAPGSPLLKAFTVQTDPARGRITAAFLRFRFRPALKDGRPVAVWIRHRIRFEFQE